MKNIWSSEETFTAAATIEAGFWMMENVFNSQEKRTGIVAAIDKATGYDKEIDKQLAEQLIPILKDIIKAKKVLEKDYSKEEEMLSISQKLFK